MLKSCKYLTTDGWKDGWIKQSFVRYGEKFHEVIDVKGESHTLSNWKVRA